MRNAVRLCIWIFTAAVAGHECVAASSWGALSFTARFGGSGLSAVGGAAVDSAGNTYVAGWTDAPDLRVVNAVQGWPGGGTDAFVAKIDPSGAVLYCTYLGGRGDDRAFSVAVDSSGNAYVGGWTTSTDFHVTGNAPQPRLAGTRNAFITKLSPAGDRILFSTYLGASYDAARGIAVDGAGNIVAVGETTSAAFPTVSAIQNVLKGHQNAFITVFNSAGAITFSTFFGGSGTDSAAAVAIDHDNNLYLTGSTDSPDFPVRNAIRSVNNYFQTAFVAKISSARALVYATYFGGGGSSGYPEMGLAIDVDSAGSAYVSGVTSSKTFPVLAPSQGTIAGFSDAFAAKLSAAGQLLFSTYVGGASADYGTSIKVWDSAQVCMGGYTSSTDFPVLDPLQPGNNGLYDAFVTCFNPSSGARLFSTLLGGRNTDSCGALAFGPSGLSVAGQTGSPDFPLSAGGNMLNAFVTKVALAPSAPALVSPANPAAGQAPTLSLSWTPAFQAATYRVYVGTSSTPPFVGSTAATSYGLSALQPGATYYWRVEAVNTAGVATSDTWSFTVRPDCAYAITPESATLPAGGGTGSISVSAAAGCSWTATASADWLRIVSGPSGSGTGTITYFGDPNTTGDARTATVSAAGVNLAITQPAAATSSGLSGDFDRNGVPDLVYQHVTTYQVSVWYMSGPGGTIMESWSWLNYFGSPGWHVVAIADFNRDGVPDLVYQNDARQVSVWYMGGTGSAAMQSWTWLNYFGSPGWRVVAAADFNRDGVPDLVWENEANSQISIWYMGGVGGATMQSWNMTTGLSPSGWQVVAAADLNNDGVPDLILEDTAGRAQVWYMGDVSGAATQSWAWLNYYGSPGWRIVGAADFNGDGVPDLVWQNDTTYQVAVWYMGGVGGTTMQSWTWLNQYGSPAWRAIH